MQFDWLRMELCTEPADADDAQKRERGWARVGTFEYGRDFRERSQLHIKLAIACFKFSKTCCFRFAPHSVTPQKRAPSYPSTCTSIYLPAPRYDHD